MRGSVRWERRPTLKQLRFYPSPSSLLSRQTCEYRMSLFVAFQAIFSPKIFGFDPVFGSTRQKFCGHRFYTHDLIVER